LQVWTRFSNFMKSQLQVRTPPMDIRTCVELGFLKPI
jgi:hypothetical protein